VFPRKPAWETHGKQGEAAQMKSDSLHNLANRLRLFANNGATAVKLGHDDLMLAARACEIVAEDAALQEKMKTKETDLTNLTWTKIEHQAKERVRDWTPRNASAVKSLEPKNK
jgi:hypothetical protein